MGPRAGFTNSQVRDSVAARLQHFRQDVGAVVDARQMRIARAVEVREAERAVVITALHHELDGLAGLARRGNGRIEPLDRVLANVHGDELYAGTDASSRGRAVLDGVDDRAFVIVLVIDRDADGPFALDGFPALLLGLDVGILFRRIAQLPAGAPQPREQRLATRRVEMAAN